MVGEWDHLVVTDDELGGLAGTGFLPRREDFAWRVLDLEKDPRPTAYKIVRLAGSLERGIYVSASPLVRCLLGFYGIQLHHLIPEVFLLELFFI